MSNLHPIFEQALKPFAPPAIKPIPQDQLDAMRDKLYDEYEVGFDAVSDGEEDEGEQE